MHPDILWQLATQRRRDLMTEAAEARRAREARHAQRRRPATQPGRLIRLAAQQLRSRRESRIPVTPAAGGPGRGVPVVLTNNPKPSTVHDARWSGLQELQRVTPVEVSASLGDSPGLTYTTRPAGRRSG